MSLRYLSGHFLKKTFISTISEMFECCHCGRTTGSLCEAVKHSTEKHPSQQVRLKEDDMVDPKGEFKKIISYNFIPDTVDKDYIYIVLGIGSLTLS